MTSACQTGGWLRFAQRRFGVAEGGVCWQLVSRGTEYERRGAQAQRRAEGAAEKREEDEGVRASWVLPYSWRRCAVEILAAHRVGFLGSRRGKNSLFLQFGVLRDERRAAHRGAGYGGGTQGASWLGVLFCGGSCNGRG